MKRAERSLAVAWHDFEDEYWAESLSRAYYAMFYAAHALICTKGLTTSKHSGVIAMVGEHFAKPGLIERRLHRSLTDMFDERQVADYEVLLDIRKSAHKPA